MQKILTIILLSFMFISCNGQVELNGKTYVAKIGETCKDGIGMIYTSRILKFDKSTVTSSYKVIASVSPERKYGYEHMYDSLTKTYKWRIDKGNLIIENGKELEKMKILNTKLIGYDNNWNRQIEFTEQTK